MNSTVLIKDIYHHAATIMINNPPTIHAQVLAEIMRLSMENDHIFKKDAATHIKTKLNLSEIYYQQIMKVLYNKKIILKVGLTVCLAQNLKLPITSITLKQKP